MKILVISHVSPLSPYGAATSIKNHIECIRRNFDVVTFYNENFPSRRDRFFCFKISPNYTFFSGGVFKRWVYRIRNWLISLTHLNVIESSRYDLIHFNSLVLIRNVVDVLSKTYRSKPYIVFHVREVLDLDQLQVVDHQNLEKVDLFICVDSVTEKSLLSVNEEYNTVVITNPVQVNLSVLHPSYNDLSERFLGKKVLAIIGTITPDKGVEFILRAFQSISTNCCLLIIGENQSSYAKSLLAKYSSNNDIIAVGEINDVSESGIYKVIDVLIRAEEFFCVGRTTLEALYSGIKILQPCDLEEQANNDLTELFDSKLLNYYIPRNIDSFVSAIDDIDFSRSTTNTGSNLSLYEERVMRAYESIS